MSTVTANLGLKKPSATDNVDISVINANMDSIDAFAKAVLLSVHPIGSLYLSMTDTNPASIFGGESCIGR